MAPTLLADWSEACVAVDLRFQFAGAHWPVLHGTTVNGVQCVIMNKPMCADLKLRVKMFNSCDVCEGAGGEAVARGRRTLGNWDRTGESDRGTQAIK